VFQTHVSIISSAFGCMLQTVHLDVSTVDRVCTCCDVTHLPQPPTAAAGAAYACGKRRDGALRGCGRESEGGSTGNGVGGPRLARACSSRERPSGTSGR